MTSFFNTGALARRSLVASALLSLSAWAQAQSIQWSTGQVAIDFDPSSNFTFTSDTI